jgi:formylglycine-generating enzyme required for sulfatase activity
MSDQENQESAAEADHGGIANTFRAGGDIKNNTFNIHNAQQFFSQREDLSEKEISKIFDFEPETILISNPQKEVWMGNESEETPDDKKHPYRIYLSVYRISKYLITNAQYAEFVRQIKQSDNSTGKWDGLKAPEGPKNDPIMGVTLDDTKTYCDWLSASTGRKYSIPNEAQLEKAYQDPDGCSDGFDNLLQWTCTLWGTKALAPDSKYQYPWNDNEHNNLNANSQIRRVVCLYPKQDNAGSLRVRQRCGKFPWDAGFPGARHSFRVVIAVPFDRKVG